LLKHDRHNLCRCRTKEDNPVCSLFWKLSFDNFKNGFKLLWLCCLWILERFCLWFLCFDNPSTGCHFWRHCRPIERNSCAHWFSSCL